MSFDKQLLDIICCPATHMPLRLMPETVLERLNGRIESGKLRYRDDSPVTEPLEQALMTEDERLAYPIRDDIPLLLEEFGILIAQGDGP
ncbi:MAG TPA: Trm112 family protein [Gammaproteobacteria bacterium]|nr:Trm112 family protein [Gammaproteobacteria bacterium]